MLQALSFNGIAISSKSFLWSRGFDAGGMYAARKMLCFPSDPEEVLIRSRNSCCNVKQTRWPTAHRAGNAPGHSKILAYWTAALTEQALIQCFWQVHMVFNVSLICCRNIIFYCPLNLILFKFCSLHKTGKIWHWSEKTWFQASFQDLANENVNLQC